jgi:NAD(P)H-hydrate epimerase
MTVTLGLGKVGQYLSPARESSGEVVPVEISIPEFLFDRKVIHTLRIQREDVAGRLSKRSPVAHKYSVGKVFVLAGSTKFTGAAFLSAQSSLKAGAGAVVLGTPNTVAPVLSRKFNEVIVEPLESTGAGSIALGARDKILERIQWADAVVLGPGLSRNEETVKLLRELIIETYKPLVLDADALFALAGHLNLLKQRTTPTILTPHTGELGMLTGEEPNSIERRRVEAAREAARRFQCIVCLKGNPTVTAEPYGTAILNSSGNPGMATIGSGDVLAGVIGSFLAQRIELIMSACSAVFVHGLAGDLARSKFGERSVLASDILNSLPNVLQGLETT